MNNEFEIPKDGYLTFDAYSLKRLINSQLAENSSFTDQVFEGSNLSTINNIISYAFNSLMFYLNQTSTESMFSEAQIYENINRIVKILSYKPIGIQTATLPFSLSINTTEVGTYVIPRYSYFTSNGVAYSFAEDIIFDKNTIDNLSLDNAIKNSILFQGRYREHTPFISTGENIQVFTLSTPSSVKIDHFNIHVYVYDASTEKWDQWRQTDDLFLERGSANVYSVRLNQDKNYEVKFGDNINGKMPPQGSKIAVYYLESKGEEGEVGPGYLQNASYILFTSAQYLEIYNDSRISNLDKVNPGWISATNTKHSSPYNSEETTESIRRNAPGIFRSQLRLVTNIDYENYIRTNFSNFVHDLFVYDNEEYLRGRISYLHSLGVNNIFKDTQVSEGQLFFASSCNFNNVYITAVPKMPINIEEPVYINKAQKQVMLANCNRRKTLTSQIVFVDPVYMNIDIALNIANASPKIEDAEESQLIIEMVRNSRRTRREVLNDVERVFRETFAPQNRKLGDVLNITKLNNDLLSIDGVNKIWTRREDNGESVSGIRLIVYNPVYKQDTSIIGNSTNLLPFQFGIFKDLNNISRKIKIEIPGNNFQTIDI